MKGKGKGQAICVARVVCLTSRTITIVRVMPQLGWVKVEAKACCTIERTNCINRMCAYAKVDTDKPPLYGSGRSGHVIRVTNKFISSLY